MKTFINGSGKYLSTMKTPRPYWKIVRYTMALVPLFLSLQSCLYSIRKSEYYVRERSLKDVNYGYHYNPKVSFLNGRVSGSGSWYDSTITQYRNQPFTGTSLQRTGWNKYALTEYINGRSISYLNLNRQTQDTLAYNYDYQNRHIVIRYHDSGQIYWYSKIEGGLTYYVKYAENGNVLEKDSSFFLNDTTKLMQSTQWDENGQLIFAKTDTSWVSKYGR